jgi:hypothetical protein
MRLLPSVVLGSVALLSLGCSLDTDKFDFTGPAGAAGALAGGAGGGAGTTAGEGGAGAGDAGGEAGNGGEGGLAGEGGSAGAAGGEAGSAGAAGAGNAGAAGVAGAAGAAGMAGAGAGGSAGGSGVSCITMLAGAQRCTDKTVETCFATNDQDPSAAGTWTPDAKACDLGCVQSGIHAACAVCTPGEKVCDEQGVATCGATGAGYTTAACSTQLTCDETLLSCVACTPGKPVCAGASSIPCSDAGTLRADQAKDCGSAALCSPGVGCLTATCAPSEFVCSPDQKAVERCKPDGTGFQAPEACKVGQTCYEGLGCAECDPTDTSSRCVGDNVAHCVNGQLSVTANCATGACDVDHCITCDAGSVQCSVDGKSIQTCQAGALGAPTACATGTHCSVSAKACVVCEPSSVFCAGDTLSTCATDGKSVSSQQACGAGLCDALHTECDECTGNARRCQGDQSQTCDSNGHFVALETCATKGLCDVGTGTCLPPACKVDETGCGAGKVPLVCNVERTALVKSGGKCDQMCFATGGCANILSVVAGPSASCAIVDTKDKQGIVVCWGNNPAIPDLSGATLFGGTAGVIAPRRVPGLENIQKIVLGNDYACVLSAGGGVACWGAGGQGRLGVGDDASRSIPTKVDVGETFDLAVAPGSGACAISQDQQQVQCWGMKANAASQADFVKSPEKVDLPSDALPVTSLDVTNSHRCIVGNEGAYCWGFGGSGQIGNNGTVNVPKPAGGQVVSSGATGGLAKLSGVTQVQVADGGASARASSCSVLKGRVFCWGSNSSGQLGSGDFPIALSSRSRAAEVSPALASVVELGVGNEFACAVSGGTVACWGTATSGRNGGTVQRVSPDLPFKFFQQAHGLSVGVVHSCVIGTDTSQSSVAPDSIFCWGENGAGQLGVPSSQTSGSANPIAVPFPDSL